MAHFLGRSSANFSTHGKLKSEKGKAYDALLGIPVAIWDGAVELVAMSIEGAEGVSNAIEKGIKYVQNTDWYRNLSTADKVNKASTTGQARKRKHDKTLQLEAKKLQSVHENQSNSKRSSLYKQTINSLNKSTDKDRIRKKAKEARSSNRFSAQYYTSCKPGLSNLCRGKEPLLPC
jgi:hypothetical protein